MADEVEFDEWDLGSGLFDHGVIGVKDGEFGYRDNYMDGNRCLLVLDVTTDDENQPETEIRLGLGDGWEPESQGKVAVHETGKPKRINMNTAFGFFLSGLKELDGAQQAIADRGSILDVETWKGLMFRVERRDKQFKFKDGDERTVGWYYPVEFLGAAGDTKPKKAAGTTKKATATKDEDEGDGETEAPASLTKVKLKKMAKEHDDYDEYMAAVGDIVGEDNDEALETADGVWDEVNG